MSTTIHSDKKFPTRITAVPVTKNFPTRTGNEKFPKKCFRPGAVPVPARKIPDGMFSQSRLKLGFRIPEQYRYLPEKFPTGCPVPTKIGLPDPGAVPVPAEVPARKIPDPDHSSTGNEIFPTRSSTGTCQKNPTYV